jgi:YD repeat-containing protein
MNRIFGCIVIISQLLFQNSIFANTLPDEFSYEKMEPMVFYATGDTINNTRRYYWTPEEACIASTPGPIKRSRYTDEFTNPRVGEKAGYGVGCYYHLRRILSTGRVVMDVPNWFGQDWFDLVKACEAGWTMASDGMCSRLRYRPRCPVPVRGNPVVVATGAKVETQVDIQGSLALARAYSSRSYEYNDGIFGNNWFLERYERSLSLDTRDTTQYLVAIRSIGREVVFRLDEGVWSNITGSSDEIRLDYDDQHSMIYEYRSKSNNYIERYDNAGKLIEIAYSSGKRDILEYSNSDTPIEMAPRTGLLIRISTLGGNSLSLRYNEQGKVVEIIDGKGRAYKYAYEIKDVHNIQSTGLYLTSVSYPDETSKTYHYDSEQSYKNQPLDSISILNKESVNNLGSIHINKPYSMAELVRHYRPIIPNTGYTYFPLTGISDESGIRISNWEYDSEGRVIVSEHYGNTDRTEFSYFKSGASQITTVTNALGDQTSYNYTLHGDEMFLDFIQYLNGRMFYSYDANGFIRRKQDRRGSVTTYTRDNQGRELSRTEAPGTPQARTITTTWDTILNKPLTINEPDKHTVYTYDTEGRLLSRRQIANQ